MPNYVQGLETHVQLLTNFMMTTRHSVFKKNRGLFASDTYVRDVAMKMVTSG